MNNPQREDRIRERAHQIWQHEGMKDGDHERHWTQAKATDEIDAESVGSASTQTNTGGSSGLATGLQPGGMSPGGGPAAGADSLGSKKKGGKGISGPT
ncbi:DUF2934 domain-containing protein [Neorhizobium petrolearium]|uniref:DUF2934 domain-containing protein n=1 Tax=Neorhizobium petrolearium TaxID=515361 RepID=UPI003F165E41